MLGTRLSPLARALTLAALASIAPGRLSAQDSTPAPTAPPALAPAPPPALAPAPPPALAPAPAPPSARRAQPAAPRPAADAGPRPPALQEAEADSLLAAARERFEVFPLRDGVLLLPKYEADVQSVQVAGGTIAIDGRTASGPEIASRLREDAPLVLRLSYVPPEQLARVAGGGPPAADTSAAGEEMGGAASGALDEGRQSAADAAEETARAAEEAIAAAEEALEDFDPDFAHPGDVVRMGSGVEVAAGETIGGDVVSIGGDVDVAGTVLG
ncbi:MAG: hypothetical protein ABR599_07635, partial [Gemmatimonadota bacterium]